MNERLERIARGCWSWLAAHLDDFSFDTPLIERRGLCMTAMMELMLFVTAARRVGAASDELDTIAERLISEIPRYDWESSLLGAPGFVVSVLTVVEFLEAHHRNATNLRSVARASAPYLDAIDAIPYRRMEIERLLMRLGFARFNPSQWAALCSESLRPLHKPLALYTREELFALAHIAFYLCDDGAHAPTGLDIHELEWLRARVRACVRLCILDRETDMLGEFILACAFLGVLDDALLAVALDAIEPLQETHGGIPQDTPAGPFIGYYHATLIWAYAGSAVVRAPALA